ncbi:MAG: transporter [Saprospiraceae bacterium]|nr:transporter [Saprospiraceae bacterium]
MAIQYPFRRKRNFKETDDLGFGTRIIGEKDRLIAKDGKFNVVRVGLKTWSPYQDLVEMTWVRFFGVVIAFFVVVNVVFALLLNWIGMDCLNGVQKGSWLENFEQAWFFSVQTFTTVGYGSINPSCISTNFVAATIALVGLMSAALATGLLFVRFSKPTSQLVFSKNAIITPYRDGTSFQFRIANMRNSRLINLDVKLTMSWVEPNESGTMSRKFARLKLEREKVVMLPLNWNIVHPIDEESPFWERSPEDLAAMNVEVIVLIEAFDEVFSQTIFANSSYCDEEFLHNVKWKQMYYPDPSGSGKTILDLARIDETMPIV